MSESKADLGHVIFAELAGDRWNKEKKVRVSHFIFIKFVLANRTNIDVSLKRI